MTQLRSLSIIFLLFSSFLLTSLQSSQIGKEKPPSQPSHHIRYAPYAGSCNVCSIYFTSPDSFLEHARRFHSLDYDATFFDLKPLYTPYLNVAYDRNQFIQCLTCNFPVPIAQLQQHADCYHVTSARAEHSSENSEPTNPSTNPSTSSSSAPVDGHEQVLRIRRKQYLGQPMRSDEYLSRFGPIIPSFDEYMANVDILSRVSREKELIQQMQTSNPKSRSKKPTK